MTTLAQPAPETAFDRDSVLRILQEVLNSMIGQCGPICADTIIPHYLEAHDQTEEIDYLDIGFRLEARLGFRLTNEDWDFIIGWRLCKSREEWEARYAPFATFGRLADLIAQRASLGIVRPVTILGSTSLAAGAFRQIEAIVRQHEPNGAPFAPSTPILDRLKGESLRRVWIRCQIISGNRIPSLIEPTTTKALGAIFNGLFGAFLVLVAYGFLVWQLWRIIKLWFSSTLLAGILSCYASAVVLWLIPRVITGIEGRLRYSEFVLPKDIRTFRDLAELIAGDRGGWCAKCGYDLTGLIENRCPECGKNTHEPITPPKSSQPR